jgi:single-strand DNA-binding protein
MSLPTISGVGRLTADPELRYAANGTAVATANLAFNERRRDESGNWVDGDVFFVRATAFKTLAENMVETLEKGTEVHVSGRLKTEQWTDKNSGDKRSAVALILSAIGPNLAFATAKVAKVSRSSDGGGGAAHGSSGTRSSSVADDPWGSVPPPSGPVDEEAPF